MPSPVAHYLEATTEQMGEVLCQACVNNVQLSTDDLKVICQFCVAEHILRH